MTERQMILWFKIIFCMGSSDFVGAYDIMLGEIAKRSVGFCLGYGATRCAKTLGEYALGPVSDLSIIQDYIVNSPEEEFSQRISKLVT